MTHDLDCTELIDFGILILEMMKLPIDVPNLWEHGVVMLFNVMTHFWVYCV